MQRLTEADRDSQRNAGSCIEMHRQLGRQSQAEKHTERDTCRDSDSLKRAFRGKEIYTYSATEADTEIDTEILTGRGRDSQRGM